MEGTTFFIKKYDISSISNFIKLNNKTIENNSIDINTLKLNKILYTTKNNKEYKIIRYDKNYLSVDLIPTQGLFRSVIVNSENLVVGFSPPKMYSYETFISKYPITYNCIIAEEFVEGTMINVFWDNTIGLHGAWEIATRNSVGCELIFVAANKSVKILPNDKTFRSMFLEAAAAINLNINNLNPEICYSFILQHPNICTICPFIVPQLYLIEMYYIQNNYGNTSGQIIVFPINIYPDMKFEYTWINTTIKFPEIYAEYTTASEIGVNYKYLKNKYASMNTSYNITGVVIRNKLTNDRCKIRNPNYEYVKSIRGSQPKLQYQYLCLRQQGKVHDFLTFYPENKKEFSFFRNNLHTFTNTLYQNYVSCYIRKEKNISDFPEPYRNHMIKIHQIYMSDLKPIEQHTTNTVVINYVNKLHPHLQMYNLNYSTKKRYIDFIKSETAIS